MEFTRFSDIIEYKTVHQSHATIPSSSSLETKITLQSFNNSNAYPHLYSRPNTEHRQRCIHIYGKMLAIKSSRMACPSNEFRMLPIRAMNILNSNRRLADILWTTIVSFELVALWHRKLEMTVIFVFVRNLKLIWASALSTQYNA